MGETRKYLTESQIHARISELSVGPKTDDGVRELGRLKIMRNMAENNKLRKA